ncbi:MAG: hypothetical protein KDA32_03300 [Phycisphaerales bacterium]|nr:hypothetical protein [Phycisphaerales bacterium]
MRAYYALIVVASVALPAFAEEPRARIVARLEHDRELAWTRWVGDDRLLCGALDGHVSLFAIEGGDGNASAGPVARIEALPGVEFVAFRNDLALCFDRSAVIGIRVKGCPVGEAWRQLGGDIWLPRFGDQDPEFLQRVQAATLLSDRAVMFVNDGHAAALRLTDGKPFWAERLSERQVIGLFPRERLGTPDEPDLIIVRQAPGMVQLETMTISEAAMRPTPGILLEGTPTRVEAVGSNVFVVCPDRGIVHTGSAARVLAEGAFSAAKTAALPGPTPSDPPYLVFADATSVSMRSPAGTVYRANLADVRRLARVGERVIAITPDSLGFFSPMPDRDAAETSEVRDLPFRRVARPKGEIHFGDAGDRVLVTAVRQQGERWRTLLDLVVWNDGAPQLVECEGLDERSLLTGAPPMIEFQDGAGLTVAISGPADTEDGVWFTSIVEVTP